MNGSVQQAVTTQPLESNSWLQRIWSARYAVASFAFMLLFWELAVRVLQIPDYLLPPPSKIFSDLMTRWPRVWDGSIITTQEIVVGYALAVVVSIPLSLMIAYSTFLE